MKIAAQPRQTQGSSASRRLRRTGRVPAILYGGTSEPRQLELDHNEIYHALRKEAFHSSILDMEIGGAAEKVLLRDVQWHPYKQLVLHVDFQRVSANQALHMKVPFHFINAELSPAVKQSAAVINHVLNEVDITCLPADLPGFIEVDLQNLTGGQSLHLSDIKLPKGVTVVLHGQDDPVVVTALMPGGGASAADEAEAPAAAPAAAAEAPAKK